MANIVEFQLLKCIVEKECSALHRENQLQILVKSEIQAKTDSGSFMTKI